MEEKDQSKSEDQEVEKKVKDMCEKQLYQKLYLCEYLRELLDTDDTSST